MTSLEEEKLDEVRKNGFHYSGVKLSEANLDKNWGFISQSR